MIGTTLGPYQIVSKLGEGGMGEVYRATDTKLGRDVALKVLPDAFARDPERLARFEREARALAALNHPNIAQVYGFEGHALVMELLDGETLRDRLSMPGSSALPTRKAVEYASQIARGLAAAHERGIIHRDMKPENLFVLRDGQIKILDFGLARQLAPEPAGASQTMTSLTPATDPGTVMGTVGYMAPEQVRGGALDARADLFALGCVLYEMLTGQRAFRRETAAETMTAILNDDPPEFAATRTDLNPALDRIVRHCLEKNPNERFQTARDVAFALNALSGSSSAPAVAVPASRPARMPLAWIGLSVVLAGVVLWQWLAPRFRAPDPLPVVYRASVPLPDGFFDSRSVFPSLLLAVSPDGRTVAVTGDVPGQEPRLWLVSLTDGDTRPLPGTEFGLGPMWSPDSSTLAFLASKQLHVVRVDGGAPTAIGRAGAGSWLTTDALLVQMGASPIWKAARGGGVPYESVLTATPSERNGLPWALPGGQRFLYRYRNLERPDDDGVYVSTIDGKDRKRVLASREESNINVAYANGAILHMRGTSVLAQPFDLDTLEVTGDPVTLAQGVESRSAQGSAFSVSTNGTLVYLPAGGQNSSRLMWVARNGESLGTVGDEADYSNLELARDGRRLLVSVTDQAVRARDVYIVDIARGMRQRLTFDPSEERSAVWSPDGRSVIYNSKGLDLYARSSDFTGSESPVQTDRRSKDPREVSPDGKHLLYRRSGETTSNDIWVMSLEGDRTPRLLLGSPFNENYACFSPDGRAIVYTSDESGQAEVYVMMIEGAGGKVQVSTGGGTFPRWPRDGREILYLAPDNTLMSVPLTGAGATFQAAAARPLFKIDVQPGPGTPFDVTADGQRFIVNTAIPLKVPPSLRVVFNWPSLMARGQ